LDHVYWRADLPDGRLQVRPSAGPQTGQTQAWTPADYCAALDAASTRLQTLTGVAPLPLFRAPGGKTSPRLLGAARACGYAHVGWAQAGFLGDELPSEKYSNSQLLAKALRDIRPGDILMAHLGIWSRKDPWAPAVLEPLITGLQAKGFCFETLRAHPDYQDWLSAHPK
jgi:peptidoglycan/xylan/chitin deacetylase (PgdA/CDA1 family)